MSNFIQDFISKFRAPLASPEAGTPKPNNWLKSFMPPKIDLTAVFSDYPPKPTAMPMITRPPAGLDDRPSDEAIMKARGVIAPAIPPQTGRAPVPSNGFKYQMGQKDYSALKPQISNVLKGTPLEAYADQFIQAGNKYGVDPRVLITIANNESSLGRRYPTESYNPFGYLVNTPQTAAGTTGSPKEQAIWQGLRNAGFTSLPHAIDALTGRFQRQPSTSYQKFYQDPSIENLQMAYNANPAERENYLKNAYALTNSFR